MYDSPFDYDGYRLIKAQFESGAGKSKLRHTRHFKIAEADERRLQSYGSAVGKMDDRGFYFWLLDKFPTHDPLTRQGLRLPGFDVTHMAQRRSVQVGYFQDGQYDDPHSNMPALRRFTPDGTEIYRCHYAHGYERDPGRGRFAEVWTDEKSGLVTRANSYHRSALRAFTQAATQAALAAPLFLGSSAMAQAWRAKLCEDWNRAACRPATLAEIAALNGRREADEVAALERLYSPDSDLVIPGFA